MYEDLRERAIINIERKIRKKRKLQVVAVIFGAVSVLLFVISLLNHGPDAFWIRFPILILGLIYSIIHTAVLGVPFLNNDDIREKDIENEIIRIYRRYRLSDKNLTEDEILDLQELESLRLEKLEDNQEFV